jgi:N-dimethylarginine dimethylaminohydrolase
MFRLLLCPPDFYGIEYEINPWMDRAREAQPAIARSQWEQLRRTLVALNCTVDLVPPRPGLPDMVFTANAGLVVGNQFIRANFRHPQRQGEAQFFEQWFSENGYEVIRIPNDFIFEGEGDALSCGDVLFCGYHFRSDIQSHQWLAAHLGRLVVSVELTDPRFYHLDTCFCPISANAAIWHPDAFDEYAQAAIRQHVPELIAVSPDEASRFACNAIVLAHEIVLPDGCPDLTNLLSTRGYRCHGLEMSEFIKAGGACKCLTLILARD